MPDTARAAAVVTGRTRALIAYHWSGDVADLAELSALARARGIKLVSDASEAFGAEFNGRRLGAQEADYTVYSFSAVRHVTAGDGAAVVVADPGEFEPCAGARRYGIHARASAFPTATSIRRATFPCRDSISR